MAPAAAVILLGAALQAGAPLGAGAAVAECREPALPASAADPLPDDESWDATSLLKIPTPHRHHHPGKADGRATIQQSIAKTMGLTQSFTVSGTHFAQGYTTASATTLNPEGMKEDCDNINLNLKLSTSFRDDVFSPGLKGFFYKCQKVGRRNKYWFTISASDIGSIMKLCDESTVYPIVYDEQHDTYWRDLPFSCSTAPVFSHSSVDSALLASVTQVMDLPTEAYQVTGTHFAQGYTTSDASTVNAEGMKADCDNINLNKKLSTSFRDDVFSPGLKGFFWKCQKIGNRNKYWFTISAGTLADVQKLCSADTVYPIVYDEQHNTYWRDRPFTCWGI